METSAIIQANAALKKTGLGESYVVMAGVLYMVLPVMLWVATWFELWLGGAVLVGMLAALWQVLRKVRQHFASGEKSVPYSQVLWAVLFALVCTLLLGLDGRVQQSWDFIVRNPLYQDLISESWPLCFAERGCVIYPLQFWLVPAGVSALLPSWCSTCVLQLWVFCGMCLLTLNVVAYWGNLRAWVLLIGMLMVAPLTRVVDIVGMFGLYPSGVFMVNMGVPSALTQWFDTYHFFIITCLYLSLVQGRRLPLGVLLFISALLAVMHPMMAAMLFLPVCARVWQDGALRGLRGVVRSLAAVESVVAFALVVLAAVYYLSGSCGQWCLVFDAPLGRGLNASSILLCLGSMALLILPLWGAWVCSERKILLLLMAYVPVLILVWVGYENGISEWRYKFVVLYTYMLISCLLQAVDRSFTGRLLLISLFAVSTVSVAAELHRKKVHQAAPAGFPVRQEYIMDDYSSLSETEGLLRKQFFAPSFALPSIFRDASSTR